MVKLFLPVLFIFLGSFLHAQNNDCAPELFYQVDAESGLRLRRSPSTNTPIVSYVPQNAIVLVCVEKGPSASFENKNGFWRFVAYKGQEGYMFDGFMTNLQTINNDALKEKISLEKDQMYRSFLLEKAEKRVVEISPEKEAEKPIEAPVIKKKIEKGIKHQLLTEAYNYCGNIQEIDPGLFWYGFYENGENFEIRPIELQVIKSKYNIGEGLEFDIRTDFDEPSTFLVGRDKPLETDKVVKRPVDFFQHHPRELYPGQRLEIYPLENQSSKQNFVLSATGTVTDVNACPVLTKYRLKVSADINDQKISQDITPLITEFGKCGIPEIYWFGDINQDGYPDLIFASNDDNYTLFTFFMSNPSLTDKVLEKAGEWHIGKCN